MIGFYLRARHWSAIAILLCFANTAPAQTSPTGYLAGVPLPYVAPPPPVDAEEVKLDLLLVRRAAPQQGSQEAAEALADANAYYAKDLIGRFSDAAGAALGPDTRPTMIYVLTRALTDAADYAKVEKVRNPRPRPYVEDASIVACSKAFLKDQESYPSGHAMNGYVAALLLADLIPDHQRAILERGVRYGENRVVCGVHHPIDIEQGRHMAIVYVEALRKNATFIADFACAQAEQQRLAQPALPRSAYCSALIAAPAPATK